MSRLASLPSRLSFAYRLPGRYRSRWNAAHTPKAIRWREYLNSALLPASWPSTTATTSPYPFLAEQRGRYSLRAITRPARGTSLSRWWDYRVDVRPRHYQPGVLLTELGSSRWDSSKRGSQGTSKPWTVPDGPILGIRIVGALLPKAPWRECGHLTPPATFP